MEKEIYHQNLNPSSCADFAQIVKKHSFRLLERLSIYMIAEGLQFLTTLRVENKKSKLKNSSELDFTFGLFVYS